MVHIESVEIEPSHRNVFSHFALQAIPPEQTHMKPDVARVIKLWDCIETANECTGRVLAKLNLCIN